MHEELSYGVATRSLNRDGVCLAQITIHYPIYPARDPVATRINDFEARYAELLAEGILQKVSPTREADWLSHLAQGGRRARFPRLRCELTGTATIEAGQYLWCWTYRTRLGAEKSVCQGTRARLADGTLLRVDKHL